MDFCVGGEPQAPLDPQIAYYLVGRAAIAVHRKRRDLSECSSDITLMRRQQTGY